MSHKPINKSRFGGLKVRSMAKMSEDIRIKESMNVTLLVEKKTRQIVYAEAGKDFVDLVFSFLAMPIGSVVKLLSSSPLKKVGSITNLYESLEKLPSLYMKSDKSPLLNPMIDSTFCHNTLSIGYGRSTYYVCGYNTNSYGGSPTHNITNRTGSITNLHESMEKLPSLYMKSDKSPLLNPMIDSTFCHNTLSIGYGRSTNYVCGYNTNSYGGSPTHNITNRTGQKCSCGQPLRYEVHFGGIDNSSNAVSTSTETRSRCDFVKETVTFMITDDLTISPSSTIACIALLNRMNIKDFSRLEAKSVMAGSEQAVKLLWASLTSTSALNDVFSATISTTTEESSRHVDIVEEVVPGKPFVFHHI